MSVRHGGAAPGGERSGRFRLSEGAPSFQINNFDLLRLFAATQVLIFHALHRLALPTGSFLRPLELFPGVPIFFVISGYLVSKSYERQDGRLRAYFRNRFLRIYPALCVCIIVTTIVVVAFGYRLHHISDFVWLFTQPLGLIYTPAFLSSFGSGTYNGSLWTIPLELQFYFLVPLLYFFLRKGKRAKLKLMLVFGAFVCIAAVLAHHFPPPTEHEARLAKLIRYSFLPSFYLFIFGIILQRFEVFRSKLVANRGLFWLAAYLVIAMLLPQTPVVEVVEHLFLGVTMIALAYTAPRLSAAVLGGQDISYGVYIYHGLLINIFVEMHRTGRFSCFWLIVTLAFLAGGISWRLLELPMLHRKYRSVVASKAGPVTQVVMTP